jgi:serine/threonine protein kinase
MCVSYRLVLHINFFIKIESCSFIPVLFQMDWLDHIPFSFKIDMHELRLIHTDLKPENILLVSSDYIKVPNSKVPYLCQFHSGHMLSCK